MPSRSARSRSSRVNAPLAPMQCHAGRSPLGRTGITDEEVCWPSFRTSPATSTPSRSSMPSRLVAIGSSPTAPKLRTSAPSRLSTIAVPPAVPAGENRIVSTTWPSEPSGMPLDADDVRIEDVDADGGELHGFSWLIEAVLP